MSIGFLSRGIPNISPAEAFGLCTKGAVIIDLRADYIIAYKKFGAGNIKYFPAKYSSEVYSKLAKNNTYIVAETATAIHSRELVRILLSTGFKKVYNLAGGFVEWERRGLPVEENKAYRLTGSCSCQLKYRST